MAEITANAEKEAASQAAKRDMFKRSQEDLKSKSGQAAEDRLTGLAMNPRRSNIALTESEKEAAKTAGTGAPKPVKASRTKFNDDENGADFRKGGKVKKMAGGGSASSRADGCAQRGKTKGKVC
jgi:hypothetical protein